MVTKTIEAVMLFVRWPTVDFELFREIFGEVKEDVRASKNRRGEGDCDEGRRDKWSMSGGGCQFGFAGELLFHLLGHLFSATMTIFPIPVIACAKKSHH